LEAWAVGTPVIYPEAFKAYVGEAAILFNYDDPRSLADAIVSIEPAETRARLRLAGTERLKYFSGQIDEGRRLFTGHLQRLKYRRTLTGG
jgi:glycosyltransferase involved in cell wall biosynthesis